MNYSISPDRKTLTITADAGDRERIKLVLETGENEQGVPWCMADIFGPFISNSELEWINPADTGDLTDAPMLGIVRRDNWQDEGIEVLERWAFLDYQVRSPLEDLRDKGQAVFTS